MTGIIPAHAGNTKGILCIDWEGGDHPRACGEHLASMVLELMTWGDHPRACGEHIRLIRVRINTAGIIPAHAGNTFHWSPRSALARDHPRACGEHRPVNDEVVSDEGSSPRMRGTRFARPNLDGVAGIIPAHAGNTYFVKITTCRFTDHPRACGEHLQAPPVGYHRQGSSPRMRGTRIDAF